MDKLRTVNKELAEGLDQQFKSLRQQAEGLKLQRLALAGDPIVQVYTAKIQGKEDLKQLSEQLKQFDELLKKHPDITTEIKKNMEEIVGRWGKVLEIQIQENTAVKILLTGLERELELRDRIYRKQQMALQLQQNGVDIEAHRIRMQQQAGTSPLTREQAGQELLRLEAERYRIEIQSLQAEREQTREDITDQQSTLYQVQAVTAHGNVANAGNTRWAALAELDARKGRLEAEERQMEASKARESLLGIPDTGMAAADRRRRLESITAAKGAIELSTGILQQGMLSQADREKVGTTLQRGIDELIAKSETLTGEEEKRKISLEGTLSMLREGSSELTLQANAINRANELLGQQVGLTQDLHRMRQETNAQELADVEARLRLTDLSPQERTSLESSASRSAQEVAHAGSPGRKRDYRRDRSADRGYSKARGN